MRCPVRRLRGPGGAGGRPRGVESSAVGETAAGRGPAVGTVVAVHNYYQQPGGEDEVFRAETRMLSAHGHTVIPYTVHNDRIGGPSRSPCRGRHGVESRVHRELRALFRQHRPAVAHFHNTFPLVSPSAYRAARAEGVPVVQTLHNFRLCCPNALFHRGGRPCEDCLGKAGALAGGGSRLLSRQPGRDRRHRGDAHGAPRPGHLPARRRRVHRAQPIRPRQVRGGRPAGGADRDQAQFLFPEPAVGEHGGGFALFIGRLVSGKGRGDAAGGLADTRAGGRRCGSSVRDRKSTC